MGKKRSLLWPHGVSLWKEGRSSLSGHLPTENYPGSGNPIGWVTSLRRNQEMPEPGDKQQISWIPTSGPLSSSTN